MVINWQRLTGEIARAARLSFSALLAQHGHEAFYAFALYTDEDCWTVVPAANSLERLEARMEEQGAPDPRQRAADKWSSAEWAFEGFAAEPFDAICEQLQATGSALPDEAAAFAAFKAGVHQAMVAALKSLDESGFFGAHRTGAVLFVTSSDNEEAEALEDRSARLLNPPEIHEAFGRRYDVGA
jgi:hypothetical protein